MSDSATPGKNNRALLTAVHLPEVDLDEHQSSLAELSRLVTTLGFQVVGELSQRRAKIESSSIFGKANSRSSKPSLNHPRPTLLSSMARSRPSNLRTLRPQQNEKF